MAKPPFPWIGSKEKIAPYILQVFPPKLAQYVEPFGGSGAVLLALPPDPNRLDIYNDLDAELVNLFSCIKERSNVLLRELKFLPIHSRRLFEYYRDFVAHKEVYVAPGSVHITDGYERFTHTTETRRTIEKDHGGSGGSSGGSSSSGKF